MKVRVTERYKKNEGFEHLNADIKPGAVFEVIELPEWMMPYRLPQGCVFVMGQDEEEGLLIGEWELVEN